ncbi:unnamed protein product [Musa hybrid cultivar]
MSRLISSSSSSLSLPFRTAEPLRLFRPRPLLSLRSLSDLRLSPCLTQGRGPKPLTALFSERDGPPPCPSRASSSPASAPPPSCSRGEAPHARPRARFIAGGGPDACSLPKVARAAVVTALSAIILTVTNSILAQPSFARVQSVSNLGGQLIKTELLSSALAGFLAGCLHTLSGPDHLAALAPLSIGRTKMESAIVGALWGCGHDAGQVLFGLLFLMLRDRLHIEVFRTWGTRVVGLTLLVIGALGIREASEVPASCVALDQPSDLSSTGKRKIGLATFATGIVHGLQPDALMIILPALALPSRLAGAAFLCMFLVGTVFAMASYTVFIGTCTEALKERAPRITEKLTWAASLIAISMGLALLITPFFGFSLF